MELAELEQIIERARIDRVDKLDLSNSWLNSLPESIGNLTSLTDLNLSDNKFTSLPESIACITNLTKLNLSSNYLSNISENIENLTKLAELNLRDNRLIVLPESICNLTSLTELNLGINWLTSLPESIGNFAKLTILNLTSNRLTILPESIGDLTNLDKICLAYNQLTSLPKNISNCTNLTKLNLDDNLLLDLSSLQNIPHLESIYCFGVDLPRRYWTKFSDWKPEWLLDEDNTAIRRVLIEQVAYEKICEDLNSITIDTWQEYTLLKIDGIEKTYDPISDELLVAERMILLKMTCPSTEHIHILRVPPEMVSAEAAITWVNHGIHPDKFAVQT